MKNSDSWQFDAEQGRWEILNRRIGRNQLSVLGAIRGYEEAQFDYAVSDRDDDGVSEYAQKLQSEPGKFDGLFWERKTGSRKAPSARCLPKQKQRVIRSKTQQPKRPPPTMAITTASSPDRAATFPVANMTISSTAT